VNNALHFLPEFNLDRNNISSFPLSDEMLLYYLTPFGRPHYGFQTVQQLPAHFSQLLPGRSQLGRGTIQKFTAWGKTGRDIFFEMAKIGDAASDTPEQWNSL
jgi:hypothetical protein